MPKERAAGDFDLANFLPYLLNIAGEMTSQEFSQSYKKDFGMSRTEWRVIYHLGRYGQLTAREICDRSRTHKTKVSRAVKALEDRRFLKRKQLEEDRRFEELCLTKEGQAAFTSLCDKAAIYERDVSEEFTAEENEILRRCLRKLSGFDS